MKISKKAPKETSANQQRRSPNVQPNQTNNRCLRSTSNRGVSSTSSVFATDKNSDSQLSTPNSSTSQNKSLSQYGKTTNSVSTGYTSNNMQRSILGTARDEYYSTVRPHSPSSQYNTSSQNQLNNSSFQQQYSINASSKSFCFSSHPLEQSQLQHGNEFSSSMREQNDSRMSREIIPSQRKNSFPLQEYEQILEEGIEKSIETSKESAKIQINTIQSSLANSQSKDEDLSSSESEQSDEESKQQSQKILQIPINNKNLQIQIRQLNTSSDSSRLSILKSSRPSKQYTEFDKQKQSQYKIRFENEVKPNVQTITPSNFFSERPQTVANGSNNDTPPKTNKKGILKQKSNIFFPENKTNGGSFQGNQNDELSNLKGLNFVEDRPPRMSIADRLKTFIKQNITEYQNIEQSQDLEIHSSQLEKRVSTVSQGISSSVARDLEKSRQSFLSKLDLKSGLVSRQSLKMYGSQQLQSDRILKIPVSVRSSIIIKERKSISDHKSVKSIQNNLSLKIRKSQFYDGISGSMQASSALGSPNNKIKVSNGTSSILSDESSGSTMKESSFIKQKNVQKKSKKSVLIFKSEQSQLGKVQMMETLSFWQKLKKEIYADNDMEKAYKKNSFDDYALQCLMQIVSKINSVSESLNYTMNCYDEVVNILDTMISQLSNHRTFTSFFIARMLTMAGKFSLKCGNIYNSMKYFITAKKQANETGDYCRKLRVHRLLGQSYKSLKNYDKAKVHFIKMLKLSWVTNDRDQELKAYDELGIIYFYNNEVLIAQRLHKRQTENITELLTSSIRKIVVDRFKKQYKEIQHKKILRKSYLETKNNIPSEKQSEFTTSRFMNLNKLKDQNELSLSTPVILKQEDLTLCNNDDNYELTKINTVFSDSSEDETDYFLRELLQQDVIREDLEQKEQIMEERKEQTLKNIHLKFSALSSSRQSEKQNDQIYQRILQSDQFQQSVDDPTKKKNKIILISHLSRNRYCDNYREDTFKDHQYFHLKQYQFKKIHNQLSEYQQQDSVIMEQQWQQQQQSKSSQYQQSKSQQQSQSQQLPQSQQQQISAAITTQSNLEKKKQQFKSTFLINLDKRKYSIQTGKTSEPPSSKTLFKLNVPLQAFEGIIKDLIKLKKQIVVLLNNVERYESATSNNPGIKRKNALRFF